MRSLVSRATHRYWLVVLLLVSHLLQAQAPPPATVMVATVEQREMAPSMWVPGTVVSRNDAWVSAEVAGRLTQVAEVGDAIAANEPLAQLDGRALQLTLEDHQANIKRLQASLDFNAKQLARLSQLRKSDSASKTQYDSATAQREMVAQELVQARTALARTQYDLDRTTVRAQFNGRVAQRLLQAGEFAQVGARLLRLVDIALLEARANAPIAVAPYVSEGMLVTVKAGDQYAHAPLRAVVPVGDAVSRSIELRVPLPPELALVGSAIRVSVPTAQVQQRTAVPRDALHLRTGGQHVVVVEGGQAKVLPVVPGIVSGDWVAVTKLQAGQVVVLRGGERIRDGQSVSILQAKAP